MEGIKKIFTRNNVDDKYYIILKSNNDYANHFSLWLDIFSDDLIDYDGLLKDICINNDYVSHKNYPFDVENIENTQPNSSVTPSLVVIGLFYFLVHNEILSINEKRIVTKFKIEFATVYNSFDSKMKLYSTNIELLKIIGDELNWDYLISTSYNENLDHKKRNTLFIIQELLSLATLRTTKSKHYKPMTAMQFKDCISFGMVPDESFIKEIILDQTSLNLSDNSIIELFTDIFNGVDIENFSIYYDNITFLEELALQNLKEKFKSYDEELIESWFKKQKEIKIKK